MFKDFSSFNSAQNKVLQPKSVFALRDAISTQAGILSELGTLVGRYTRAYNSVQVIKYDENGDPIDVTPSEQLTVPENTLMYMKARIDQVREQLDEYRDIVADLTTSFDVTLQQWNDDANGEYKFNLGGHLFSPSTLGSNQPILQTYPSGANDEGVHIYGLYRTAVDPDEGMLIGSFASTYPDAVIRDGSTVAALVWKADGMYLAATNAMFVASYYIYYDGMLYTYDKSGNYQSQQQVEYSDFTSFCQRWGNIDDQSQFVSLYFADASSVTSGDRFNATTTEFPKMRTNNYHSDVQAIVLDNIIVPDQNLVDIKATL